LSLTTTAAAGKLDAVDAALARLKAHLLQSEWAALPATLTASTDLVAAEQIEEQAYNTAFAALTSLQGNLRAGLQGLNLNTAAS
jgi:hypothetical protein